MKYAAGIPEQSFAYFNQDFQNITEDVFANLMAANQRFRLPEGLQKTRYLCLSFVGLRSTAPCRLLRHC